MNLYQEWRARLPFEPAEEAGVWAERRVDDPRITRRSLALGAVVALALATGGGVAPRLEWGAAVLVGMVAAALARGLLLAWGHLAAGGWRAWRRRAANERAIDALSAGVALGLPLFLVSGGGGIGPAVDPGAAALAGLGAGLLARGLLGLARWP
jgi:hypothetical protein